MKDLLIRSFLFINIYRFWSISGHAVTYKKNLGTLFHLINIVTGTLSWVPCICMFFTLCTLCAFLYISHKCTPINTSNLKMTSVVQIPLHHRYFQSTETISSLTDNTCHPQRMLIKIILE